ncbi:ankyrin [Aspergillus campestris IBT 28561]|uniref:Ankyrin n=1 Tax=Aspergillus campestris (strain IBT 28561) TaxID=1392248 RepID=A0A2I1CSD7_ASPC2|nr:ankyrin [Aspergillus campestris IBT 28561]PKY00534.1 ankyrin [Aspergillus campestris IBT 28561]
MADNLPKLPTSHSRLPSWIQAYPDTPISDLIQPFNEYEAEIRKLFAQEPSNPILQTNDLNVVPLYGHDGSTDVRIRARNPSAETQETRDKYMIPLKADQRKPHGSPAVVPQLEEFRHNLSIFSEAALSEMDWSNVVVAGSAVVTSLLPVPEKYRGSKRLLREYYHEKFTPASDVDLFLYGLTEEQAIDKIKQIETKIKDAIIYETTSVRTKNAITIVSQYPTRHVQIVLRIYKSVSEILTGFDVDCSCVAFDGKQVYLAPRALASYITQANHIDLTRRSPSYENRLSKYSRRGFEIFWSELERSRVDPTIFERSFSRTLGLARLLILEHLPTSSDRDSYLDQRRKERGRPAKESRYRNSTMRDNIKDNFEDEVADWADGDEVSNYNTFTIPYGPKFNAAKVERLLFQKDLLLNSEWNENKNRDVNLHRHPVFFGDVENILQDCCGSCPVPVTDEEKEVAEQEGKTHVSGDVSFIKDNPGRQEIGSFNPITDLDWTEMAYIGSTESLCHAIVNLDLEGVKEWLAQEGADPDTRDYTGRMPLHLASLTSTPAIVQALVDHGARITPRLVDGRTALHIAAERGSLEIVRILMTKSKENEAAAEKDCLGQIQEVKQEHDESGQDESDPAGAQQHKSDPADPERAGPDDDVVDTSDNDSDTIGSFVKVNEDGEMEVSESDDQDGPDIYDVNALAWDTNSSPLHLAIVNGHVDMVEELVSCFGADVLLPIKLLEHGYYGTSPRGAILSLVLALSLPSEKAMPMVEKLLQLGATPTQADLGHRTPIHYVAASKHAGLLDVFTRLSPSATLKAINYVSFTRCRWRDVTAFTPLMVAISARNTDVAIRTLENGAALSVDFAKEAQYNVKKLGMSEPEKTFACECSQPIVLAVLKDLPRLALEMVTRGCDPNTLTQEGHETRYQPEKTIHEKDLYKPRTLLEVVREQIQEVRSRATKPGNSKLPRPLPSDEVCLDDFLMGSYKRWHAVHKLKDARLNYNRTLGACKAMMKANNWESYVRQRTIFKQKLELYEKLENALLDRGAKTFLELFPNTETVYETRRSKKTKKKSPKKPFQANFLFMGQQSQFSFRPPHMDKEEVRGYFELFEAAWRGDLNTVKKLTLAKWGEGGKKDPLLISGYEYHMNMTPFTIAIVRGHRALARAMLEIGQIQYNPRKEEATNVRYRINDDLEICSEVVDDQFTVEEIGEAVTQIECDKTAISMMQHRFYGFLFTQEHSDVAARGQTVDELRHSTGRGHEDVFEYAVERDDVELLVFLLELAEEAQRRGPDSEATYFSVPESLVDLAIRKGRLGCLEELIKRTGAQLPIDALVHQAGIWIKEKPKYYEGLSVRGTKRADWAGREGEEKNTDMGVSPLLTAAWKGSLKSTEWYLSTAPARYYLEFVQRHTDDKRIGLLAQSEKGIERPLMGWLNAGKHLVLHCAIGSKPTEESRQLIEYLLREMPGCLETRCCRGYTPLGVAFALSRVQAAEMLVQAGADQTVRGVTGNNLLHLLLCDFDGRERKGPRYMDELLGLLDRRLIPSLLTERSKDAPGSLTPLARWMHTSYPFSRWSDPYTDYVYAELSGEVAVFRKVLELSQSTGQQRQLELIDGTGNTPVHHVAKLQLRQTLGLILDIRPDLIHREDANGMTPLEVVKQLWTGEVTANEPWTEFSKRGTTSTNMDECDPECRSNRQITYDVCQARAAQNPGKRKLVSLHDAKEVIKRLAVRQDEGERGWERPKEDWEEDEEEEKTSDPRDAMQRLQFDQVNTNEIYPDNISNSDDSDSDGIELGEYESESEYTDAST